MATFKNADILLPKNADMEKWAVVACDQYTSEPEYWKKTEEITAGAPSALNFILPELYLGEENVSGRIDKIHEAMRKSLEDDMFTVYKNAMIYVERTQDDGSVRAGIVGCIDLEDYDYQKGSLSPVRATESTVVERIPPRLAVRRGAELELPHIMILIDDTEKTVIEPFEKKKSSLEKVYDFNLMQKGGSIKGWLLGKDEQKCVEDAIAGLENIDAFNKKYSVNFKKPLVFAMGDGNHSLATAKEYYEELKRQNPDKNMKKHPARYALVEIVNLHSPALRFEAIHRIVTGIDPADLLADMNTKLGITDNLDKCDQIFEYVLNGERKKVGIKNKSSKITVGSLQNFLDSYVQTWGGKIDYIHGIDVVEKLSFEEGSIGFILPDMEKSELFPTVILDGALPRKTFSMGHAWDKKYYVEARKISE